MSREFDLHLHSDHSTGSLSVESIFTLASLKGLKTISITDYNNFDNLEECVKFSESRGVKFYPGIEVPCYYYAGRDAYQIHILFYFKPTIGFSELRSYFSKFIANATSDDAEHRIDAKRILTEMNWFECLSSLAHPFRIFKKEGGLRGIDGSFKFFLKQVVFELQRAGLSGLEVFRSEHSDEDGQVRSIENTKLLYDLANEYSLEKTAGSGFHHHNIQVFGNWETFDLEYEIPKFFTI